MTRHVSLKDLQADMVKYLDAVEAEGIELIVTREGGEPLVVIAPAAWESRNDTEYLLGNPANARMLLESIAELEAGRGEEHDIFKP